MDLNQINKKLISNGFPSRLVLKQTDFKKVNILEVDEYIKGADMLCSESDNEGLYIWGASNLGKSVFAISIIRELIKNGIAKSTYYVNFPVLIDEIYQFMNGDLKREESRWSICEKVQFLLLDDFGRMKVSDFIAEKVYLLLNNRYEKHLPVVITSNYSINDMAKIFRDERLRDSVVTRLRKITKEIKVKQELY